MARIEERLIRRYVAEKATEVLDQQIISEREKCMNTKSKMTEAAVVYDRMLFGASVGEDTEEKIKIFSSVDYDKFSLVRANRPVNYDRVNRIVNFIHNGHDYLKHYPILVNGEWEIMDGQHRHAAARIAQVKLYYIMTTEMNFEDAARAVVNTKGWTMADWLHSYAERGFPEYIKLREFWKEYEWLPVSKLIELCSSRRYTAAIFNGGHYETNNLTHAKRTIEILSFFKPYAATYWRTAPFIQTMSSLASNPLYMHKRMAEKMKTQSSRLVRCATVEPYLELLSDIYNYRMPPENRVFFIEQYRRRKMEVKDRE